jgi:hypothetical protein
MTSGAVETISYNKTLKIYNIHNKSMTLTRKEKTGNANLHVSEDSG